MRKELSLFGAARDVVIRPIPSGPDSHHVTAVSAVCSDDVDKLIHSSICVPSLCLKGHTHVCTCVHKFDFTSPWVSSVEALQCHAAYWKLQMISIPCPGHLPGAVPKRTKGKYILKLVVNSLEEFKVLT